MLRPIAFVALLLTALVQPAAAAEPWPALLSVEEVRARLTTPGLRIIDLRGTAAYGHEHADGAVSVPAARWKQAALERRLPELIGAAGIHPERPLLLVHYDTGPGNFADAAWLAWELRNRGVQSVSLLEGGMQAWAEAGIPQTARVHDHRTYELDYPRSDLGLATDAELEAIGAGLMRIARVRARGIPGAGESEIPAVSLVELLGPEDALADRAGLLDRVKNAPVPWGTDRVIVVGDTPEAAPAFWFLASEVLGIDGLAVAAPAHGDLDLADLDL